jgi:uncharacterized cupin superfamily protein
MLKFQLAASALERCQGAPLRRRARPGRFVGRAPHGYSGKDRERETSMKSGEHPALPAIDPAKIEPHVGSDYPAPFDRIAAGRERRALGDAVGLKNFGVNLMRLPPGCASSQRHWHSKQDEFVYVLEGEVVLVTDAGEQSLRAGMAAGFPAGKPDGHHLVNRSGRDALVLEVGDRTAGDEGDYSDIDMMWRIVDGVERYLHKDGTPY